MDLDLTQLTHDITGEVDAEAVLRESYAPVFSGLSLERRIDLTRKLREHGLSSGLIAAALGVTQPTAAEYIRRSGAVEPDHVLGKNGYVMTNPRVGEVNDATNPPPRGRPVTPNPRLLLDEATALLARAGAIHSTTAPEVLSDPRALEAAAMMREAADLIETAAIESDSSTATGTPAPKMDA